MLFFTADPHLFMLPNTSIIRDVYGEEMNEKFIQGWNSVVGHKDETYVVGDLTDKGKDYLPILTKIINSLNGTKHMIVASTHDLFLPREYQEMGFLTVHYPAIKLENGWFVGHDPALANVWPENSIYVCGHVHHLFKKFKSNNNITLINVGVDVCNFKPVSEEQIAEEIRK